ncbi:minor tail protein [Streptomyces phage Mischief19]|nr:minor tail protein [Streptomyces phage Mischief19]
MLTDYMNVGGNEVINNARLRAYLANVGSPFDTGAAICGCDTIRPDLVDDGGDDDLPAVYETPQQDPAPWYDPDLTISGEFLGFLPLSITGLTDNTRARNVTNAVGGGGVFGPSRALPRTIVVSGLLIGTTCCGVDYGMHWLTEALAGCTGDACSGDCITMYNCCPEAGITKAQFDAESKRTFRNVALVDGPTETGRRSTGSCARSQCAGGGDIVEVEFTLVAASPFAWTDEVPLLDVNLPVGGTGACVEWCLSPVRTLQFDTTGRTCVSGECNHAPCKSAIDACADPRNTTIAPPQPTAPDAAFCVPIADERACYTISLATRPQWSSDVPVFTVRAGSSELRNVRVAFYERKANDTRTCETIAEADRCNPVNEFVITYIPKNGSVTIDGRIGQATTECAGECQTASTVFGDQDGGPLSINELTCASYCVCLFTDPTQPPAADAHFSLSVSGRGY